MTRDTKKLLAAIDAVLMKGDKTSEQVWNVLTALRGPDTHSDGGKAHGTVPIRVKAFPRTAKKGFPYADMYTSTFFLSQGSVSSHFDDHIRNAAFVLNLKEGQVVKSGKKGDD